MTMRYDSFPYTAGELRYDNTPFTPGGVVSVYLGWVDNAGTEDDYTVERSDGDNLNFLPIATIAANSTEYEDSVAPGDYWYRTFCSNSDGDSIYSNETSITAS